MKRILVLGGGFAGLWSAVGAMRKLAELKIPSEDAEVVLIDQNSYHNIRVRNYESNLSDVIVPLDDVLEPIGVRRVEARAAAIDSRNRLVSIERGGKKYDLKYDRLILALGSQLHKPDIPGLGSFGHDVDTYASANALASHLRELASRPRSPARETVVVVGAGLTGLEVATEMPDRIRELMGRDCLPRVILVDQAPVVGSDMGVHARPVIEQALKSLGIELRLGVNIAEIMPDIVTLGDGEMIPAATTIWCGGMRASPLAKCVQAEFDKAGRVFVDQFMRVKGVPDVFAAGDIAVALIDGTRPSVMSCQHGRPMGRYAGHNAVADLCGEQLLPLNIDSYVTVLDLGPAGAVYTKGWERLVVSQGATAKQVKHKINRQRIYPPRNKCRADILLAGAPIVQSSPEIPPHTMPSAEIRN